MPLELTAVSTAAFGLTRTLGGTVGIAVGGSIFSSDVQRRVRQYVADGRLDPSFQVGSLQRDISSIHQIPVRSNTLVIGRPGC